MTEFTLKDIPKHETLRALANRYTELEPSAVEAYLLLLRVSADILNAATSRLNRHGITPARFMALMLLNMEPDKGQNPSFLSERAGVSRATMTGLITGLEKDGYVKRINEKTDRREVLIYLTPSGSTFINSIIPGHLRCISGLMKGIPKQERKQLIHQLIKIQKQVGCFNQDDEMDEIRVFQD